MAVIEEVLENNAMAFLAYSNGLTKKNYVDYVRDNEIYSSRDNFSRIIVDKEKLTNDDKEKIRARFINTLYRNGVGRNTNVEITDPELVNGQ
jgi:hypothetical protein